MKLALNWRQFGELLLATGDCPIVEESRRDPFWGAKPIDDGTLVGTNVLGRLLMELREELRNERSETLKRVEPLRIPHFLIFERPIGIVGLSSVEDRTRATMRTLQSPPVSQEFSPQGQTSFFDNPPGESSSSLGDTNNRYMIRGLNPYPRYKESGLPWLGHVPSDWEIKRAKSVLQTIDIRSETGKEELLTVSSARGIVPRNSANVTMFKAESYLGYKLCWPGDLVINSLWAWARGLGVSKNHGIISSAYGVYRIRDGRRVLPRFLHYLVRSEPYQWELHVRSRGVWTSRLQLTDDRFLNSPFPLPPPEEQAAIVRYLDWTCGRLDRVIRAKRKVIALLDEQKQAIIERAVTRGLNPNAPLKAAGVPSMDPIPEHWQMRRLRSLVRRIDQGVSPLADGFLAEGDSWGVLKSGCVNHGVFREKEHKKLASSFRFDPQLAVNVGDVLISRACGSPKLVGSVGRVRELNYHLILSDKTFRPVFTPSIDVDFAVYAMNSRYFRRQVEQAISGAEGLANNLPLSSLRDFVLAVPPAAEGREIAKVLKGSLAGTQHQITRIEREISLLLEYRTRLIADVVTGKLDVREAGAGLPTEEPDVQNDAMAAEDKLTDDELTELEA